MISENIIADTVQKNFQKIAGRLPITKSRKIN